MHIKPWTKEKLESEIKRYHKPNDIENNLLKFVERIKTVFG